MDRGRIGIAVVSALLSIIVWAVLVAVGGMLFF
jgi:hypothetical protein